MLTVSSYPLGWVAIHSPVEIGFQRKDANILGIGVVTNIPEHTEVRITATTIDLTGKTIYINSGAYVGNYLVSSQANYPGNYTSLVLVCAYKGSSIGGYIVSDDYNINYYIEVNVYADGVLITTNPLKVGTFTNGTALTDISEILKGQIDQFPTSALTGDAVASECYKHFSFTVQEKCTDFAGIVSNPYYFWGINAVKQNGDVNGSRMVGYEPYYDNEAIPNVLTKGKFLQSFVEPVFNINKDFELSFIWQGGMMQYYLLTVNYEFQDINKAAISTTQKVLNMVNAGKLVRLNLSDLTIPSTAYFIKVSVDVGDTRPKYVASGYVASGYVY
jgi:hypothetical protein